MTDYLVTYDLDEPGQEYARLISLLKSIGAEHFQKSAWLVRFDGSADALKTKILTIIDNNDKIMVVKFDAANYATDNPNVSLWLTPTAGILGGAVGLGGPFSHGLRQAYLKQPGLLAGNRSLLGSFDDK